MRLLVDVGNTRLKWRLGGQGSVAIVHRGQALNELLFQSWAGLEQPAGVIVASVAGRAVREAVLEQAATLWPNVPVRFLTSSGQCCGVRVAYQQPERFGVDRLAALVAARDRAGKRPLIVVDAGTAVTLDALDAKGIHLGGMIMPGLRLLRESLLTGTENVDAGTHDERGTPGRTWAGGLLQASTHAAVMSGVQCMLLGGVERAILEATQLLGGDVWLGVTGGDAEIIARQLDLQHAWIPDLVLDGVALMASSNV